MVGDQMFDTITMFFVKVNQKKGKKAKFFSFLICFFFILW